MNDAAVSPPRIAASHVYVTAGTRSTSLRKRGTALAVAFDRDRLLVHPDDRAVLADVAVLDRERFAGAVGQVRRRQDAVPILVVHPADPQGGVIGPFLRRETQDLLDLRAHVRRGHRAGGA